MPALTPRQERAIKKLDRAKSGAVWWRVGTGKTRVAYGIFATVAKRLNRPVRFVVVCRRLAFEDWKNEAVKFGLSVRFAEVDCDYDLWRKRKLTKPIMVYLVSHGMLKGLFRELMDYSIHLDGIVYDEGYLYKSPKSLHCKCANALSERLEHRYILSGSVMTAKNIEDLFGQMYAIDAHAPIGRTLTEFRSEFMYQYQLDFGRGPTFQHALKKGAMKKISDRLKPVRSFYFPADNEREIHEEVKVISPSEHQRTALHSLKEMYWLEHEKGELEVKNALSLMVKAQQISDGFLVTSEGETVRYPSPKMDHLLLMVEELIACGEKVIIWCAFRYTVRMILQRLQKAKIKGVYAMSGGERFSAEGWRRDGQVVVATEASGSSVNHFKDVAYAIYYSMDTHWLNLQQSQGRTNRHDSAHSKCFYYFLQTKTSLDSHIHLCAKTSKLEEQKILGIRQWMEKPS